MLRIAAAAVVRTQPLQRVPGLAASLERQLLCLSLRSFSAPAAVVAESSKPFPPNLYIDRRSSFAPQKKQAALPVEQDDDSGDDDDDKGDDRRKRVQEEEEGYDSDDDETDRDDDDLRFEPATGIPVIPLPQRLHVPVYHFGGTSTDRLESVGTMWLEPFVFGLDPIRVDLLKRAVDYHRAKKRGRRKAVTKKIGDIRGSGRKMRPQKGGGTARAGHKMAAHWRGGAKAHGPRNETDYGRIKLNKKVRRLALRHVLAAKLKQGDLFLVNQFHTLPSHKTKVLREWLKPFGIAGRHGTTGLLMDHYYPEQSQEKDDEQPQASSYRGVPVNLTVAAGNLHKVKLGSQLRDLNVYDVLKYDKLILTLDALTAIEARFKDD